MTDNRFDEYLAGIAETVAEYGLAIQGVGPGDGEPQFAYTVGLARFGQPELIVFGLPMPVAQALLNDVGLRIVAGTLNLAEGDVIHQLVRDFPVRVGIVRDPTEHLTVADRLYGPHGEVASLGFLAALQLIFPDPQGRWPWEPGSAVAGQPLLGGRPSEGREITLEEQ